MAQGRERTKEQLYREAKRLGVKGRSKMNKGQLKAAVDRRSEARCWGGRFLALPRAYSGPVPAFGGNPRIRCSFGFLAGFWGNRSDRLETAQDRRLRRRLRASRPLNTSKMAQPRSATAQSFQEPNHSRFGVPCTSQTMSQTKLATDRSLRYSCALAAQSTAQRGRAFSPDPRRRRRRESATRVASSRDRAPSFFSKLPT
jgi:hypothetical protein